MSEPGGKSAGRPPKIDEPALRERYGEAGVALITLLYRLRTEGGFTIKEAASAWARRHPDDPAVGKLLGPAGKVDQRRLSELMKMPQPLPRGLVQAFVDLWMKSREDGEAERRAAAPTLDELNRLDAAVRMRATAPPAAATFAVRGRASPADHDQADARTLRAELDEVQLERDRYRKLAVALAVIVVRLDEQLDEQLRLLPAATSSSGVDGQQNAPHAAELRAQLARADRQRDQAMRQIERAVALGSRIEDRLARLCDSADPQRVSGADDVSFTLGRDPILVDNDDALDRVQAMLPSPRLDHAERVLAATEDAVAGSDGGTPDNAAGSADNSTRRRHRVWVSWIRRRRIQLTLVVVLVLSVSGAGITLYQSATLCEGLSTTTGPGFALSKVRDECIGWTTEHDFAFSQDLREITRKITDLNQEVGRRWSAPDPGRAKIPYVQVAAIMPMTEGMMSTDAIRHSLEGVYAAQARANDLGRREFRDPASVGIQVMLVNEGRQATHWSEAVKQLTVTSSGEHPVVAAVGMGISSPEAKETATALSQDGIVSIGGVITATDMIAGGFFKVAPSNEEQARTLASYIQTRQDLKSSFLVYDTNDDSYTRTLQQAFDKQLGSMFPLTTNRRAFTGTKLPHESAQTAAFSGTVNKVCETRADLVVYAGRERDLTALLNALITRECAFMKPVTIAAATTGPNVFLSTQTAAAMQKAQLSVVYTPLTQSAEWAAGRQAPEGYRAFHEYLTRNARAFISEDELADGYAILHHDALAAATWAIRLAAEEKPATGNPPDPGAVALSMINMHGDDPVPAASGTLAFDDRSEGWPHCRAVPVFTFPGGLAAENRYKTGGC
ncbi:hypothetical protein ABZ345_32565 [Lentzea sp. NPDC005914]|uniref:hypothetical protein n=1 Tax=Lentzea sp. NPDC005914 TaxID=3154572 RepID=UPI0033F80ACD